MEAPVPAVPPKAKKKKKKRDAASQVPLVAVAGVQTQKKKKQKKKGAVALPIAAPHGSTTKATKEGPPHARRSETRAGSEEETGSSPATKITTTSSTHQKTSTWAPVDGSAAARDPGRLRRAVLENEQATDSEVRARRALAALLAPVSVRHFYQRTFEKRALAIVGRGAKYAEGWLHEADVWAALSGTSDSDDNACVSGVDVDVTRVVDDDDDDALSNGGGGKRVTLEPPSKGQTVKTTISAAWAKTEFARGASVRLRCPQERLVNVHRLCEALEDEFGATVSANAYFTPPGGNQGFAPHFDDVDVFVFQTVGAKRWTVWRPPGDDDDDDDNAEKAKAARSSDQRDHLKLPRHPSSDFESETAVLEAGYELVCRDPQSVVESDLTLRAGDLLYLPRGFVHVARTAEDEPSLHLTVSTHRQNAWADLLDVALSSALERARATTLELRQSLPRDLFHYAGLAHRDDDDDDDDDEDVEADDAQDEAEEDEDDEGVAEVAAVMYDGQLERGRAAQKARRRAFREAVKRRLAAVVKAALEADVLDAALDELAAAFVAERQPPFVPSPGSQTTPKLRRTLEPASKIWPRGRRVARLVADPDRPDKVLLYHALHNAKAHRKLPVACLDFDVDDAPALEMLLKAHVARPVRVDHLPHPDLDDRIAIAQALYDEGLLLVEDDHDDGQGHEACD